MGNMEIIQASVTLLNYERRYYTKKGSEKKSQEFERILKVCNHCGGNG